MSAPTLVQPWRPQPLAGPGLLIPGLILLSLGALWLQLHPAINQALFLQLNHLAALLPAPFWAAVTNLGDGFFAFAIASLLLRRNNLRMLALLLASLAIAVLVHLLKDQLGIARPPAVLAADSFNLIGAAFRNGSFPSGHTTTVFLLATLLCDHFRQHRLLCAGLIAAAILAGLSRIAVGVHWPADLLAGAVLGTACAKLALGLAGSWRRDHAHGITLTTRALMLICALALLQRDNGTQGYSGILQLQYGLAALLLAALVRDGLMLYRNEQNRIQALIDRYPAPLLLIQRLSRFALVGSSGFVVDISFYSLLLFAGTPPLLARSCAYWLSASWNWLLNRTFTFADRPRAERTPQWLKYLAMCLISFVPNWGCFYLLTTSSTFFSEHSQLALIAGVLAGMLFNFSIACRFIFNSKSAVTPL